MIIMIQKILTNILTALYQPFGFALLLSFFAMYFYMFSYHGEEAGKGWKIAVCTWFRTFKRESYFRKLFLLVFFTVMILFKTLLNRNMWANPLSNVMDGWWIWKVTSDGSKTFTTECFENLIMMFPFTVIFMWTMKEKVIKKICLKNIVGKCTQVSLYFSLTIEFLQLFLRLGTFQLSDIVYNTLGGSLGGVCYWILLKIKNNT